ncbi:sulfurtransferase TusA family protein [Streptomyces beijiangensis]|uniref:TusA-related sulfurtransferase n=1 Tax=Streptomyces beijiangensis TaxID=163361 RepID=A0A939F420_9ACTN|nr:hypothetical protein [Streptomyces beijiangensis]MBO0511702.1 hypothetical protein [Streptomyces beijiangensis]
MSAEPHADRAVHALIDAGGEPWSRVRPLLERRCQELPAASLIELHSSDPQVCEAVPGWCAGRGGVVTAHEERDGAALFWIRTPSARSEES